jgi:predicted nucleotidyltransferase
MYTKDEIIKTLQQHKEDLNRLHVKELALFGSVARGDHRPDSDIDILVEFSHGSSFDKYCNLSEYLQSLFHQDIDVVTFQSVRPQIMESIKNDTVYVT